eukprot:5435284-Alexandrium_andersonii.AAC.1
MPQLCTSHLHESQHARATCTHVQWVRRGGLSKAPWLIHAARVPEAAARAHRPGSLHVAHA